MKAQPATSNPGSEVDRGTLQLLNREAPGDYREEWTKRIANRKGMAARGSSSVLVFRIGPEWLALPTHVFQKVAENCAMHAIPHRRSEVLAGLINLRGELIVCASLAALLGIPQATPAQDAPVQAASARMLVVNQHGGRLAIPVDEVANVVRFGEGELKAVPATLSHGAVPFTIGLLPWEGRMVGCLDGERLFRELDQSFA